MTMTYRGTVKNGVVVFDSPTSLTEGTAVRVEPVPSQLQSPTTPHFQPVGDWEGPPGELDRLLADVQATRDGDVDLERGRGVADALERLSQLGTFERVDGPSEWQREVRGDRDPD